MRDVVIAATAGLPVNARSKVTAVSEPFMGVKLLLVLHSNYGSVLHRKAAVYEHYTVRQKKTLPFLFLQ